jgi:glycosyltransferase involved in cell wall biosynthesis
LTENQNNNQEKILLVIVPADLNQLVSKGEIVQRYYNPDNCFDRVELVSVSSSRFTGDSKYLRQMCGNAELSVTWIKRPSIILTLGWRQFLLRSWTKAALDRITVKPDLIRIYGLRLNCLLALAAKEKFQVPLVASVHEHGDRNRKLEIRSFGNPLKKIAWRLYAARLKSISRLALNRCESIICVYKAGVEYVNRISRTRPELIYNCVSREIAPKENYRLSDPPRLLTVGNLIPGVKGPVNVIKALRGMDVTLDVIGDGPLLESLQHAAVSNGMARRVNFLGCKPNEWIVKQMPGYDIYLFESQAWEMSKSVIEAMLCGLPIIVNQHRQYSIAEIDKADGLVKVDNNSESYRQALLGLLGDESLRKSAGTDARNYASKHFDPVAMELKTAGLYRKLLADANTPATVQG